MRRARPRATLACTALLSACAASGGGQGAPPADIRRGVEGTERVVLHEQPGSVPVAATLAATFEAVGAVFEDLGLEPNIRLPREGRIAAEGRRLVRLAERRASYWVDCGADLSGTVADNAQVLLTLDAAVTSPGGSVSVLLVRVDAEARARGGMEGVRECRSTGRLEALVAERVRARVGGGGGI